VAGVTTTLARTTIGSWTAERRVNLERAMRLGDRLGGHLVQGHVDGVAHVTAVDRRVDALVVDLALPRGLAELMVQHGSLAVDGVSLTVNDLPGPNAVQISLIAYTLARTNLGSLAVGDAVHIEADMLGKYVQRLLEPWDT
jgi:riboflavin synthase